MKWLAGAALLVTAFALMLVAVVMAPATSEGPAVNDTVRAQMMPVGCGGC